MDWLVTVLLHEAGLGRSLADHCQRYDNKPEGHQTPSSTKVTAQQAARSIEADTTGSRLGDEVLLHSVVKDHTMMKKDEASQKGWLEIKKQPRQPYRQLLLTTKCGVATREPRR